MKRAWHHNRELINGIVVTVGLVVALVVLFYFTEPAAPTKLATGDRVRLVVQNGAGPPATVVECLRDGWYVIEFPKPITFDGNEIKRIEARGKVLEKVN